MLSPRGGLPHDTPSSNPPDMGAGVCGSVHEWQVGLPTAAELTPLSHPLIPRALAAAFLIDVPGASATASSTDSPTSHLSFRCDDDDEDGETEKCVAPIRDGACRGGKVRKKRRMVWTAELHRRFIEAVSHLGDKAAVPKAILEVMNVDGMTREHVASHLQKYRVYLKLTRTTYAPAPPGLPAMPPTSLLTPPTEAVTDRSSPSTATSSATKDCL